MSVPVRKYNMKNINLDQYVDLGADHVAGPEKKRKRTEWFQGMHTLRPHPQKTKIFEAGSKEHQEDADECKGNTMNSTGSNSPDISCPQGSLIWARLGGKQFWPAIVIPCYSCRLEAADTGNVWVFWFGDHRVSEVPVTKTVPFINNFSDHIKGHSKLYKKALSEVLEDCARRVGYKCPEDRMKWASEGFPGFSSSMFAPCSDQPIPSSVQGHLDKIVQDMQSGSSESENEHRSDCQPCPEKKVSDRHRKHISSQMKVDHDDVPIQGVRISQKKFPETSRISNSNGGEPPPVKNPEVVLLRSQHCNVGDESSQVSVGQTPETGESERSNTTQDQEKCLDLSVQMRKYNIRNVNLDQVWELRDLEETEPTAGPAQTRKRIEWFQGRHTLRPGPIKTKIFQAGMNKQIKDEEEYKAKKMTSVDQYSPEISRPQGSLIWAWLGGKRFWPAMVIPCNLCRLEAADPGNVWVFWFGDHKVSEVPVTNTVTFNDNFSDHIKGRSKLYEKALSEVLEECARRVGYKCPEDRMKWASEGFPGFCSSMFAPCSDQPIPSSVQGHLDKIVQDMRCGSSESEDDSRTQHMPRTKTKRSNVPRDIIVRPKTGVPPCKVNNLRLPQNESAKMLRISYSSDLGLNPGKPYGHRSRKVPLLEKSDKIAQHPESESIDTVKKDSGLPAMTQDQTNQATDMRSEVRKYDIKNMTPDRVWHFETNNAAGPAQKRKRREWFQGRHTLRPSPQKTQTFQAGSDEQENGLEKCKGKKIVSIDSYSSDISRPQGSLIWARLGRKQFWPAIVIPCYSCRLEAADTGNVWVFWFGDHRVSEVPVTKTVTFINNFSDHIKGRSKLYEKALSEVLEECARRIGYKCPEDRMKWASEGFPGFSSSMFAPCSDQPIPSSVQGHLDKIVKDMRCGSSESEDDSRTQHMPRTKRKRSNVPRDIIVRPRTGVPPCQVNNLRLPQNESAKMLRTSYSSDRGLNSGKPYGHRSRKVPLLEKSDKIAQHPESESIDTVKKDSGLPAMTQDQTNQATDMRSEVREYNIKNMTSDRVWHFETNNLAGPTQKRKRREWFQGRHTLRPSPQRTQTFQAGSDEQENGLEKCKGKKMASIDSYSSDISRPQGSLIWARLGRQQFWPAIVIPCYSCRLEAADTGNVWVFWFGDHRVSEVPLTKTATFIDTFSEHIKGHSKLYEKALSEVLEECARRVGYKCPEDRMKWASEGFPGFSSSMFAPCSDQPIPSSVQGYLDKIVQDMQSGSSESEDEHRSDCQPCPEKKVSDQHRKHISSQMKVDHDDVPIQGVRISQEEFPETSRISNSNGGEPPSVKNPEVVLQRSQHCNVGDESSQVSVGQTPETGESERSNTTQDQEKCLDLSVQMRKYNIRNVNLDQVWELRDLEGTEPSAGPAQTRKRIEWFQGRHTLRPGPIKTKIFQAGMNKQIKDEEECKCKKMTSVDQYSPEISRPQGSLIWAWLGGKRFWPAMVIPCNLCRLEAADPGNVWVFWFGDHKVSEVPVTNTVTFNDNFSDHIKGRSKLYEKALSEVLEECARRVGYKCPEDRMKWASEGFPGFSSSMFAPCSDQPIPSSVQGYLDKIVKDMRCGSSESEDDSRTQHMPRTKRKRSNVPRDIIVRPRTGVPLCQVNNLRLPQNESAKMLRTSYSSDRGLNSGKPYGHRSRKVPLLKESDKIAQHPESENIDTVKKDSGLPAMTQDQTNQATDMRSEVRKYNIKNMTSDRVWHFETNNAAGPAQKRKRREWFQGRHTLRPSPQKTQTFQAGSDEQENGLEKCKGKKMVSIDSYSPDISRPQGSLIWARLGGKQFWPAIVIPCYSCRLEAADTGNVWVFWFGDHRVSEVPLTKTVTFINNFSDHIKGRSKLYEKALSEVLEECARRIGYKCPEDRMKWASEGFPGFSSSMFAPCSDQPIPSSVQGHLDKIVQDMQSGSSESENEHRSDCQPCPEKKVSDQHRKHISSRMKVDHDDVPIQGVRISQKKFPETSRISNSNGGEPPSVTNPEVVLQRSQHCNVGDESSQVSVGQTSETGESERSNTTQDQEKCLDLSVQMRKYNIRNVNLDQVWELWDLQGTEPTAGPAQTRKRIEWFQGRHTLRPGPIKTKIFQAGMNKQIKDEEECKCKEMTSVDQYSPEISSPQGSLIWAWLGGKRFWPAMVIPCNLCRLEAADPGNVWVFWFGDHKVSEVPVTNTVTFNDNFSDHIKGRSKLYEKALSEVLEECARRVGYKCPEDRMKWASEGFPGFSSSMFAPCSDQPIPSSVQGHLDRIAESVIDTSSSSESEEEEVSKRSTTSWRRKSRVPKTGKKVARLYINQRVSEEPSVGQIVWACLTGHSQWPAMIIRGCHCGLRPARADHVWVFWYGDHTVSEIWRNRVVPFVEHLELLKKQTKRRKYKEAVMEVLQDCARRLGADPTDPVTWALNALSGTDPNLLKPDDVRPIPHHLQGHLDDVAERIKQTEVEDDDEEELTSDEEAEPRPFRIDQEFGEDAGLNRVRRAEMAINDVCLSCNQTDVVVMQHPLFEGGLCAGCLSDWKSSVFAYGHQDGSLYYCVICSSGGELFICGDPHCYRVYCPGCVRDFVGSEAIESIRNANEWNCFMCSEWRQETHGLLKHKPEWRKNMVELFQPAEILAQTPSTSVTSRKPIRVLSLFDGIGTAMVVLKQLGLEVEAYYTSEVDPDATIVTRIQHPEVVELGDVQCLTKKELKEICPIDLVLGGSPCNELSLANPDRKGLSGGTGLLFFEFYRVLRQVSNLNDERHLFWLFENTSSMAPSVKSQMNMFFGCKPALWDAKHFTAMQRARYFWGNIPGLYCPRLLETPEHDWKSPNLNSVLMGNRSAAVSQVRTVTTRSNSLMQGKLDRQFPVIMDDIGDTMWTPELERVFGFPAHYTDIANLPATRRQRLIGKAWCVPVIRHLLGPLRQFYKSNIPQTFD